MTKVTFRSGAAGAPTARSGAQDRCWAGVHHGCAGLRSCVTSGFQRGEPARGLLGVPMIFKKWLGIVLGAVIALGVSTLISSPAFASTAPVPTQLSIGQPKLGPLGASVVVSLTFTCDPALNVAFGDVSVAQVSGHKLAQGSGTFTNAFPGVPCTGVSETMTVKVSASGGFAFKKGKRAIGSADLTVFDPASGNLSMTSITGQALAIAAHPAALRGGGGAP